EWQIQDPEPACEIEIYDIRNITLANYKRHIGDFILVVNDPLSAACNLTGLRVDAHHFALFHEQRDTHFQSSLEFRDLRCAAGRRITAYAGLGGRDREFDILR